MNADQNAGSVTVEPGATDPAPPGVEVRTVSACICVSDLDRSVEWYGRGFGFRPTRALDFPELDSRVAYLVAGDARIELVETRGSVAGAHRPDPPRHTGLRGLSQLTFYVADLHAALASLRSGGTRPVMAPVEVDALRLRAAFVRDPDGTLLELIELLAEGPAG